MNKKQNKDSHFENAVRDQAVVVVQKILHEYAEKDYDAQTCIQHEEVDSIYLQVVQGIEEIGPNQLTPQMGSFLDILGLIRDLSEDANIKLDQTKLLFRKEQKSLKKYKKKCEKLIAETQERDK